MKNKIVFVLNYIWTSFIAFTFPVSSAIIYMNITGHSKGYSYNLGDEKDISILLGFIELVIWLLLAVLPNIALFKKLKSKGKIPVILTIIIYMLLIILCVYLIGGWKELRRWFNI